MSVKVIKTTDLRSNLSDTLDDVSRSQKPILVRRHNSADVALVSIDLLEDLLELHDPEYVRSIETARNEIKQGHGYSFDEVFGG